MNTESIKKEIEDIILFVFQGNGFDADMLSDAELIDDLGMDSIMFMSLIVEIEERFGIVFPDDKLLIDNFRRGSDIVTVVEKELRRK